MSAPVTSLPPGPRVPPFVQTFFFVFAAHRWMHRNRRKYGDLVTYEMAGGYRWVMVSDPALIKEVFTGSPHVMYAGEANDVLRWILGDRSVLLLDGDEHLRHRKLLLPPFHGARMREYEQIMRQATVRSVETWPVGEPFSVMAPMQAITLEVIMRAVFGVEVDDSPRHRELHRSIRAMIQPVSRRLGVLILALSGGTWRKRRRSPVKRFQDLRADVLRQLAAEVADRRAQPDLEEREDVLSMLLLARDAEGEALSDDELLDELMTLLVAGHETTATALAWVFERLLRSPGVLAEATRAAKAGETDYLDAVVKEALRVRPIIPSVGRILQEDHEIAGYTVPKGVELSPAIAIAHERPEAFPEPRAFRPERFLDKATAPDTYTWLPFGGGSRRCLGAAFAMLEMRIVLEEVLKRTELEPVGGAEKTSRRGITLVPSRGGKVRLRRRVHQDSAAGVPAEHVRA